jgi:hypothetical protein
MSDESAPLRRYYTRTQVCELYQFSTRTFDRMLASGEIGPPTKKFGDTRLWSSESVEAMGNSNLDAPSRRRLHHKPVALPADGTATDPLGRRGRRPKKGA